LPTHFEAHLAADVRRVRHRCLAKYDRTDISLFAQLADRLMSYNVGG
jgi:hypothetical protein